MKNNKIPHTHKMPKCRMEIARHDIEYVFAALYTLLSGIVATAAVVVSHRRNIIIICVLFVTWKFSMPWSFNRNATYSVYLCTRVLDLTTLFSKHTHTHSSARILHSTMTIMGTYNNFICIKNIYIIMWYIYVSIEHSSIQA